MLLLSFFTVGVKAQLLYKISGNGLEKPSYVVGIDRLINPQGVVQGISGIKEAMIATDQMYFETSPDSLSYLEAAYKMPAGKTLKTVLTPAQYASLNAFLKKYEGVGLESPHVQKRYGALSPLGLRAEMEKMTPLIPSTNTLQPRPGLTRSRYMVLLPSAPSRHA